MAATNTTVTTAQTSTPTITLTASTVDTVTFSKGIGPIEAVEIDWGGEAAGRVTVDGSTPSMSGNGTGLWMPAAAATRKIQLPRESNATLQVKVISSGAATYSVSEAPRHDS